MATTLVAAALVVVLGGCGSDDEIPDSASVEDLEADRSGTFDLDEVEAGQRISLRVTVVEVLSPDAFVVPPDLGPKGQYTAYDDKVVLVATLNDDDLPLDDQ